MSPKKAVLLINLGSPKNPSVFHVAKYLRQFLSDGRVIDIPWFARMLLVHLLIVPFRSFKSSKAYKKIWSEQGFPLIDHTDRLSVRLQEHLTDEYRVYYAMRYQAPSIASVLNQIKKQSFSELTIIPLFPQYASSTNGSAIQEAIREISGWWTIPELRIIPHFFENPKFIEAWVQRAGKYELDGYDAIIFSFHGLPQRHLEKGGCADSGSCSCDTVYNDGRPFCYRNACCRTAREIARRADIDESKVIIAFQSRFAKNWLHPFTDTEIIKLARNKAEKVLVFSPAFTADCLETIVEIGEEYSKLFVENGGSLLELVPSLNEEEIWVEALKAVILS